MESAPVSRRDFVRVHGFTVDSEIDVLADLHSQETLPGIARTPIADYERSRRADHIQIRWCSAPAKLYFMELDQAQAAYDVAHRRVMSDLASTTGLGPDVAVDFTDPNEMHYWYLMIPVRPCRTPARKV